MKKLARLLTTLMAIFFAVAIAGNARATGTAELVNSGEETEVVVAPRDEPLVLQPEAVKIPAVPSEFVQKDLGWMTIAYPPAAEPRVASVIKEADSIKTELGTTLGEPVLSRVDVRIARSPEEMTKLAPEEVPPPPYATGVAYSSLHLVLVSLSAPGPASDGTNVDEVMRHELAHIALQDATQGHHVPRWFNEGFAIHASGESPFQRWKTLENATLSKQILPLSDLDQGFPQDNYDVSVAYAESADFVRYLVRDGDEHRFTSLVSRVREGDSFDRALGDAYTTNLRRLEFQWREDLSKRFTLTPVLLGGSFLWVLVAGLMGWAYVKKRRKAKETLARWEKEERALELARLRLLEGEPQEESVESAATSARNPLRAAGLPKVHHDGHWHTLH